MRAEAIRLGSAGLACFQISIGVIVVQRPPRRSATASGYPAVRNSACTFDLLIEGKKSDRSIFKTTRRQVCSLAKVRIERPLAESVERLRGRE